MLILCKENCLYKENEITLYGQMETNTRNRYKKLDIYHENNNIKHKIFFLLLQ